MSLPKKTIRITGEQQRQYALSVIQKIIIGGSRVWEVTVKPHEDIRTLEQNSKQWPMLQDIAEQKQMCINGSMIWAEKEDWKDLLTAGFRNELRIAQGIDGRPVPLPMRTRRMKKAVFSEWIEFLYMFGAEHDIEWSERSLEVYREYREAA